MNSQWNLEPIYRGFSDPAFEADLTALREKVDAFAAFCAAAARAGMPNASRRHSARAADNNRVVFFIRRSFPCHHTRFDKFCKRKARSGKRPARGYPGGPALISYTCPR